MKTKIGPWILLLLLASVDTVAAGQNSLSAPAGTSDRPTQRVTTGRGRIELSPTPDASKPLSSADIAVQIGGAPIELHGLPEQSLEIPFCRTAEFQFETTGGWGQVSGWAEAQKVNTYNYNNVPATTVGADTWKMEKIETGEGTILQGANGSSFPQPGLDAEFKDQPAARTRFRVQLTQDVRPRIRYQGDSRYGIESHRGRIVLHLRDTNGHEEKETVETIHTIGPDTVRGVAVLQKQELVYPSGHTRVLWFMNGQANYIGCGSSEVPPELLSMDIRSASGRTLTTTVARKQVGGDFKEPGVKVRFRVGGHIASGWFSAERKRNILRLDD